MPDIDDARSSERRTGVLLLIRHPSGDVLPVEPGSEEGPAVKAKAKA